MRLQLPVTDYTRAEKVIVIVMMASAILTHWAYIYSPLLDGDIWFHMLYGKFMVEHHTLIPDHTIYSWTPSSNNTIYCAWIGELIYFSLYKLAGYPGIIVLRYITSSFIFVAIFHLARQRNVLYNPIIWFTATLCILAIEPAVLDKPEALSFALMTMLVLNWYKVRQLGWHAKYLTYLFPLLMLIWVNTHGAFLFGCIFLFCVGVGETINQFFIPQNALPRKVYYHLCAALMLSAGATLVTPYGSAYIQQLIFSVSDKQLANQYRFISSYMSTFAISGARMPLFAYTAVALLVLVFVSSLRKKQLDFVPVISNLVFAFIFTRYGRSIYLWLPVFSLCIVHYAPSIIIIHPVRKKLFISGFFLASFILSGLILYQEKCYPTKERWLDFGLGEYLTIDDEISFIQNNFPHARVGNVYDHGAYMLWKMWPETKVMIDARYFPYKKWFQDYIDFEHGLNIEGFIQKYPFDVIEIEHRILPLLRWFLHSKEWKLAFYGKSAAVFVRTDLSYPEKTSRGRSLENILAYETALNVFTTALLIKDWQGAEIILATMKRNFKCDYQKKLITGLEYNKLAIQMYEQKDYTASIDNMEKAFKQKVVDKDLYAAALLNKALEQWRESQYDKAIKNAIKSYFVGNTFAAHYNVAVMAWQLEILRGKEFFISTPLSDKEREVVTKWRDLLKNITLNKSQLPDQYVQFEENAEEILNGTKDIKVQFIQPDYGKEN